MVGVKARVVNRKQVDVTSFRLSCIALHAMVGGALTTK